METTPRPAAEAPRRALILYSDIGEGHAATARALAAELAEESPQTEVVLDNGLAYMGRFLRYLQRDLYHSQLVRRPWLYGMWYGLFAASRLLRALGAFALCLLGSRPLLRLVSSYSPDVVVSTDPRVSVVLGHLRMRKKLVVPLYATITDLGGLKFWIHPGVDVHLATHPDLVPVVERLGGAGSAKLVRPPVHPAFYRPVGKTEARSTLGLPSDSKLVLLSGGGWGMGDFEGALLAALTVPDASVLCLCGRNEPLKQGLQGLVAAHAEAAGRVQFLGFTERMSDLLAAVDVLVHSTGGVTCLEASVRRCPVVIYGAPPGHTRHIARAMVELGEASRAKSPDELARVLSEIIDGRVTRGRDPRYDTRTGAVILSAQSRPHSWWAIVPWLTLGDGTNRSAWHLWHRAPGLPLPEEA